LKYVFQLSKETPKISLAPGFSPVLGDGNWAAVSTAFTPRLVMRTGPKPLKRLLFCWSFHTRLKPGVNEKGANDDAHLFQFSPPPPKIICYLFAAA
jgi:hypothetical protein